MPLFGIGKKINNSLMSITEMYRTQRCGFPLRLRAISYVSDFIICYFFMLLLYYCGAPIKSEDNIYKSLRKNYCDDSWKFKPHNSFIFIFYQHNLNCNPVWICEFLNTSSNRLVLIWCSFSNFLIKDIDIKAFSSERFKSNFTWVLWLISLHAFRSAKLLKN